MIQDSHRDLKRVRWWRFDPARLAAGKTKILDIGLGEPGIHRYPILARDPALTEHPVTGKSVLDITQDGRGFYTLGHDHDRPGIFDFASGQTRELWATVAGEVEEFCEFLDSDHRRALILSSSATASPNYFIRDVATGHKTPVTGFKASLLVDASQVVDEEVTAQRADGLKLRARIYRPVSWTAQQGPLPTLFSVYAGEYKTPADYRGALERNVYDPYYGGILRDYRAMAVLGYAVVKFSPPIVGGEGREPQDTFVPQLVADLKAMIDATERLGVVDPKRLGVIGHSYGGFTVANLLAHSDLFRAGIASNGIYNLMLAPFGGQTESRSLWQAQPVYLANSPFLYADRIRAPLLILRGNEEEHALIHPDQSPLMFSALKNLGGTVRLVELPYEGHNYQARESVLHILWEVSNWLERYVR